MTTSEALALVAAHDLTRGISRYEDQAEFCRRRLYELVGTYIISHEDGTQICIGADWHYPLDLSDAQVSATVEQAYAKLRTQGLR